MKPKNEPIRTIPDGVWEATHTDSSAKNCHRTGKPSAGNASGHPPKEGESSIEPLPESSRPRQDGPGGN